VEASAFWPVAVSTTRASIVPFGDGRHAWVADERGVYGVDEKGTPSHERGSWLVPGFGDLEVIRTVHPGRAWVIAYAQTEEPGPGEARVYLADAGQGVLSGRPVLTSERLLFLREQSFRSPYDMEPEAMLEQDLEPHDSLWVVYRHQGTDVLAVIDAAGTVTPVSSLARLGEAGELNPEIVWRIIPAGVGPRVWLKTRTRLFFIDVQARTPVRGPLLTAEKDIWVLPIRGETRAWVMAEVRSRGSSGSERKLHLVEGAAAPGKATSVLLEQGAIRQLAAANAEGTRAWVAGSLRPDRGAEGGLSLVDSQGRAVLPGGPLFPGQRVLVSVTRAGRAWVLTHTGGVYLLDGEGKVLASSQGLLSRLIADQGDVFAFITVALDSGDLVVRGRRAVYLRAEGDSVRSTPLLGGVEVMGLEVQADGRGAWLHSKADGNLYFISLREGEGFQTHLVLENEDVSYVIPSGREGYGWIQALPTSVAYVPASEVGAALTLRGGALEVAPGGRVTVEGRLSLGAPLHEEEVAGLGLDWPGSARAAEVGGHLEVILREAEAPRTLVASATRKYAPGEPPPRLDWFVSDVSVGARSCDVLFLYTDTVGTRAQLVVRGVRFQAPLTEQVWFRTTVACLVATLLFLLPMLRPSRVHFTRRWLPLLGWSVNVLGGSGLALAGMARALRIHFPTFLGVLCVEMVLCLAAGVLSPAAFRLLSSSRPFQWLVPLALGLPFTRRRILADYVAHVGRKLEARRHQANDERYVSLPASFREGATHPAPAEAPEPAVLPLTLPHPEARIVQFLTRADGGNVLIESTGGRGKSALLREVVRRMLDGFLEDPSRPLPVLCEIRENTLLEAVFRELESNPLPKDIHEVLLQRGDYCLVVDGLTECELTADDLRDFIDGRYGACVRLLLASRPHRGFRQAVEGSARWLVAEPLRLDEQGLGLFISGYASGTDGALGEDTRRACRAPDGTYLPILVRLALRFGQGSSSSIATLYDEAFRGLLRQHGQGAGGEDTELLAWAGALCLRTYWANGIRSLRYRNVPEQEPLRKLLQAGVLVPDDPSVSADHDPSQVRFFHDSMQSYLTARGLFAQEHAQDTWDLLWRAAADPRFTRAGFELVPGGGSELFEMCLHVFGPEEKLSRELQRQLLGWAYLYDDDLTKRDIARAVPEALLPRFHAMLPGDTELSPRLVLETAVLVCSETLLDLGVFYMRIANLLWPFHESEQEALGEAPEAQHPLS
jgi:hypothetical protein